MFHFETLGGLGNLDIQPPTRLLSTPITCLNVFGDHFYLWLCIVSAIGEYMPSFIGQYLDNP